LGDQPPRDLLPRKIGEIDDDLRGGVPADKLQTRLPPTSTCSIKVGEFEELVTRQCYVDR
jgi:hypothetical protein